MVCKPGGRDHDSQNQLYVILRTPRYSKQSKKSPNPFQNILILEIPSSWNSSILNKRKRWRPTKPNDPPSICLRNIEYEINIFQKTWKRHFGNMRSMSINKHKMYFWTLETLNLENLRSWNGGSLNLGILESLES